MFWFLIAAVFVIVLFLLININQKAKLSRLQQLKSILGLVLGFALYFLIGQYSIISSGAYVSSSSSKKVAEVLSNPEQLMSSLEEKLKADPHNEKQRALLAPLCFQLKKYQKAKDHYVYLFKNYPKQSYFLGYLESQMKINHNMLDSKDEKLLEMFLVRNMASLKAHRIAAQNEMKHKRYTRAVKHWQYVLDRISEKHPERKLINKSIIYAQYLQKNKG